MNIGASRTDCLRRRAPRAARLHVDLRSGSPRDSRDARDIDLRVFNPLAFFPMALELARGLSPILAGVGVSVGSIGWTSGSWAAVALDRRFGITARAQVVRVGLTLMAERAGLDYRYIRSKLARQLARNHLEP
jgi:hypothetical protein